MMKYNAENTKPGHNPGLTFRIGSGPIKILILGSCRIMPYVNYIDFLNADNRVTLDVINIVNFNWDADGNPVNRDEAVQQQESNPLLLERIRETQWFIHEHAEFYDFLNTDRKCKKNIYQYGMKPEIDISIPNWNAPFLFQDFINCFPELRAEAASGMTETLQRRIRNLGIANLGRFFFYCATSSVPEIFPVIAKTWMQKRYWWTANHITCLYSALVWRTMNEKFLKLPQVPGFEELENADDFAATPTRITQYDREAYGLEWPQPTDELQL